MAIKNNYLVEKRNLLNEFRSNDMTLNELRFFSIYLSKINPRDLTTRLVRFPLEDFQKIMNLGKINIQNIRTTIDSLLKKIVHIPLETSSSKAHHYDAFQIFKRCRLSQDNNSEWYIEVDAHDDALPLMFEFKDKYFSYQLWNALRLKSVNQFRMYELLKQYEKMGERTFAIVELKELLGLDKDDYKRLERFKTCILDVCKKALEENTDIKFTYEYAGKRGRGGKVTNFKFKIYKNKNHKDPLSLNEFIKNQSNKPNDKDMIINIYEDKQIEFMAQACNLEFTESEMHDLFDLAKKIVPYNEQKNMNIDYLNYLADRYNQLNIQAESSNIYNRFAYLKTIIESDLPNTPCT